MENKIIKLGSYAVIVLMALLSSVACSGSKANEEDGPVETDKKGIYQVDVTIEGDENTVAVFGFHTLTYQNGIMMYGNSTYIYDNIKGENTKLTSISGSTPPVGKTSYKTMDKVDGVSVAGMVSNAGDAVSSMKIVVYKDDKEIWSKTSLSTDNEGVISYTSPD